MYHSELLYIVVFRHPNFIGTKALRSLLQWSVCIQPPTQAYSIVSSRMQFASGVPTNQTPKGRFFLENNWKQGEFTKIGACPKFGGCGGKNRKHPGFGKVSISVNRIANRLFFLVCGTTPDCMSDSSLSLSISLPHSKTSSAQARRLRAHPKRARRRPGECGAECINVLKLC